MSFNGGKQLHIWKTDKDTDSDTAITYLPEWTSEESQQAMLALRTGEATIKRKIDGSCGAIIRRPDGRWDIYQRYDDKKDKFKDGIPEGYIPLPEGQNGQVQHHYYFKLLERVQKKKGEQLIVRSLYEAVDRTETKLTKDYYSVELVGPNFNKTPGVLTNGIALHEKQDVQITFPLLNTPQEWFVWLKNYFSIYRDEGLIVSHKGRYWKIHGYKFCPELPKDYTLPVLL